MDSLNLNELSGIFLNLTKEDIPINDRPKVVFSKLEEYLKEKHLLDKVVFDFVDIMHFCVFELALSNKTIIPSTKSAFQFVRQYENLSVYTLASGTFINSAAFSMLKPDSTRRKRHDELQILAKDTVDLYLTFGCFEEALSKYLWFVNEHSMNLGRFEKRLVGSIAFIEKRLRSDKYQEAIRDNKTGGAIEDFNHLANEKFKEYISNQKLDFLYQIQFRLSKKYLNHSVSLRLGIVVDSLLEIINEFEKKEVSDVFANDHHYKHLLSEKIKEYIKNDLSKKVAGFIYSLVEQNNIDERDYTKNHSDPIIDSIWEDINYLYKATRSLTQKTDNLASQLDVFQKEHLRLLSSKDQYDYRSFEGSDNTFLSDLIDKCIVEKNEAIFEETKKKRLEELDEESLKKYCKRSMNILKTYCSVPAMTVDELDKKVSSYDLTHHRYNHSLEEIYNYIKGNKEITCSIAMSQVLIEELDNVAIQGDYTFYVVGQIKAVERLLKEILIKYYKNNIYKADDRGYYSANPIDPPNSVDDLSKKEAFDLGRVVVAMTHILCVDPVSMKYGYKGIFYPKNYSDNDNIANRNSVQKHTIPFYKHFVFESRNGYFHIEQIKSYEESVEISRLTSYWLTRIIDEMLDIHPGTCLS